jgi:vanillate O-demethylase monooxygenase subunit
MSTDSELGARPAYYARARANYPLQHWRIAASGAEIGGQRLLTRRILDMPILFYRRADGGVVALEDRCPHRGTPLSLGWLEDDQVVCGYHGLRFADNGACLRIRG